MQARGMIPQQSPDTILIAGGGIGGLAAALALTKIGRKVTVLERSAAPSEAGAGIQLGPNAVAAMRALGVADAVRAYASVPTALVVRDGARGSELTRMALGETIEQRHGAPYWVVHRADLHGALHAAATAQPGLSLRMNSTIKRVDAQVHEVSVTLEDGMTLAGQALVAADGYRSQVRQAMLPHADVQSSGYSAFRTLIPLESAGAVAEQVVGAWLSPSAHVVHYPVRNGRSINVVIIVRDDWESATWGQAVERREPEAALAHFSPALRDACAAAPDWHKWSLPKPMTLPTWTWATPVTLLGDAAHPMLPFFAQGGAMALEDAVELGAAVRQYGYDYRTAFERYATARRARVQRVQTASTTNGTLFHLSGGMAAMRNAALRLLPGSAQLAMYDWLYGYKGPAFATDSARSSAGDAGDYDGDGQSPSGGQNGSGKAVRTGV